MRDERVSSKITENKQFPFILGLRDTRKNTNRWAFTKEQGIYSFENNTKSDIIDLDNDTFYFITIQEKIITPRQSKVKYWQEIYKTLKESHTFDNVEILPSYGMPIGEYQLMDENDNIINIIPVFKFQLNSYERFLESYFNDDLLLDLEMEDIKEKYFLEAENFIPISDRILNDLLSHIKNTNERPEFIEYDFEQMNEADEIIDNLAKQLAGRKTFNLNIEYDNNKVLHSVYSRTDFKNEVGASVKCNAKIHQ